MCVNVTAVTARHVESDSGGPKADRRRSVSDRVRDVQPGPEPERHDDSRVPRSSGPRRRTSALVDLRGLFILPL